MVMKRLSFGLCLCGLMILTACAPNRFFLVNSEGIFTYNRHTGQLEFMWESKSQPVPLDSVAATQQVSKDR